ncbi:nucleotide sugar dehydrogenase [Haloterrigena turkmenica DSM 5511]|uniref:UDP-N-acetyl-D-mannosamine dehydrogenase n=1 Tax=Haloterrigena turkmenica (strain ATCC 51198 / DSM 5511 / JCM 9101 / NCIMB 13204 / VKM B-1734 / 4k) TaxID=543526 RepID=D2RZA9_HALTV|nr:nucleotide sugar dehydrogenase [Haloterrigena turkmenica]ADB60033.1 nucleotide sugar dehydrogenase [Haloterrigena turkmenica DSM 5511]
MTTTLSDTKNRADERHSEYAFQSDSEEHADEQSGQTATICVVGLGYVGLPLAVGFAQSDYRVIGYDVDESTVDRLQSGVDTTGDLSDEAVQNDDISYTTDASQIGDADYVIIAVPTPIDEDDRPDLNYVESAATTVGSKMKPGTTVILESTVYPGTTREVLVPALEDASDLTAGEGFFVGYSPERATPGDEEHGLADVVKVVGAQDEKVLEDVAALYESVVDAGVHRAPSIEVAEASKVVENTQRDLNIAFVNELSMALERMDVDTQAVLEAAGTKWNFHDYRPGLVGGHCIPVDPYFLAHRSAREGFEPELVRTSRTVNESVPDHVAELTIKALNNCHKTLRDSRVLVLGLSYKSGVGDIRSSKVADVVERLAEYDIDIAGFDPFADDETVEDAFELDVQERLSFEGFDAVVVATPHAEFEQLDLEAVASELAEDPALVDVTGTFDEDAACEAGFVYRRL